NSALPVAALELLVGGGDSSVSGSAARHFLPAYVEALPSPPLQVLDELSPALLRIYQTVSKEGCDETSPRFAAVLGAHSFSWQDAAQDIVTEYTRHVTRAVDEWIGFQSRIGERLGLSRKTTLSIACDVGHVFGAQELSRQEVGGRGETKLTYSIDAS